MSLRVTGYPVSALLFDPLDHRSSWLGLAYSISVLLASESIDWWFWGFPLPDHRLLWVGLTSDFLVYSGAQTLVGWEFQEDNHFMAAGKRELSR